RCWTFSGARGRTSGRSTTSRACSGPRPTTICSTSSEESRIRLRGGRGFAVFRASKGLRRVAQLEELDRVLLEDQRLDLVAETGVLEILEPALRRDQRVVRSEQHLVLQQRVRIVHQLRREVF